MRSIHSTIDFYNLARSHRHQAAQAVTEGDRYCAWFHEKEARGHWHTYNIGVRHGTIPQHPDDKNRVH